MLPVPAQADAVVVPVFRGHIDEVAKPARMPPVELEEIPLVYLKVCYDVLALFHGLIDFHGHVQAFPVAGTPGIKVDQKTHLPIQTDTIRYRRMPYHQILR